KLFEKNKMNDFQKLTKILEDNKAAFVLLLCHRGADADAICSAFALQGLLKRFMPNVITEIGCPQGVNKPSKLLLEYLPITVNLKPNIESADVIILLDMNTLEQLDQVVMVIKKSAAPKIIVDHHSPNPDAMKICNFCVIDEKAA